MFQPSPPPVRCGDNRMTVNAVSAAAPSAVELSARKSLVKNKTFHHPLGGADGGDRDDCCSSSALASDTDKKSPPPLAGDAHHLSSSTAASAADVSSPPLPATISDPTVGSEPLSAQAFGPSRSSSPIVTLEERRKHKRSSARRSASLSSSSASSTAAPPDAAESSAAAGSSPSVGSAQVNSNGKVDDQTRSSLERQLIELKLELAQSKSDVEGWRHAHSTIAEENDNLRSQLGALLDLEEEAHNRRMELEEEVRELKMEAEEREEEAARLLAETPAQQPRAVGPPPPGAAASRSGSFSSIGDIITHFMGEDSGHTRASSDDDEDEDSLDPYSEKRREDVRHHSIDSLLGVSGLDENDLRFAAAHERDCLLRENDRLHSDLDRASAERDELLARVAALEKMERERAVEDEAERGDGADAASELRPASPSRQDCRAALSASSFEEAAPAPSSLRGYLSKVASVRNVGAGGGGGFKSSSWSIGNANQSLMAPLPPESLLWDKDDVQQLDLGTREQRPRAA